MSQWYFGGKPIQFRLTRSGGSWFTKSWKALTGKLRHRLEEWWHETPSSNLLPQPAPVQASPLRELPVEEFLQDVPKQVVVRPLARVSLGWEPSEQKIEVKEWSSEPPPLQLNLELPLPQQPETRLAEGDASGVEIINELTRQVWRFRSVESIYGLSGKRFFSLNQWNPGVYIVRNNTPINLKFVMWNTTYIVRSGESWRFMAHSDMERTGGYEA